MTPENLFQAAVLRLFTPFPSETSPEELAPQEPELARQVAYYGLSRVPLLRTQDQADITQMRS